MLLKSQVQESLARNQFHVTFSLRSLVITSHHQTVPIPNLFIFPMPSKLELWVVFDPMYYSS